MKALAILRGRSYGSPQAKNLEIAPRQAACDAQDLRAAADAVPELQPADPAASDVLDVQDLPRPRDRAASPARLVGAWPASQSMRWGVTGRPTRSSLGRSRRPRARSRRSS